MGIDWLPAGGPFAVAFDFELKTTLEIREPAAHSRWEQFIGM
jgi:hypothetical protein